MMINKTKASDVQKMETVRTTSQLQIRVTRSYSL